MFVRPPRTPLRLPSPLRAIALLGLCGLAACGGDLGDAEVDDPSLAEPASISARGVDYAWARPGGAAVKAHGYHFAARYLSHDNTGKTIHGPEVADLHRHGIGIVLVWEDSANAALGGHGRGVSDGRAALAQAQALGSPGNLPIYFAVDFEASAGEQGAIDNYLRGAASVLGAGRIGVYGSYYVVKRCFQNHTAAWGWQTLAWSGGHVLPAAHLYQNGAQDFGGGADVDEARHPSYGAWLR